MRNPWMIAVLALAGCDGPTAVECADSQRFDAYEDADADGAGDPDTQQSVCDLAEGLVTNDGELVIQAQRFRSQERNKADALERLIALVTAARLPPRPRLPTRVSKGQKKKRLADKANRSNTKSHRRRPGGDD